MFNHYKVKCAVGKRGIRVKNKEGDKITPKGRFKIKAIFYRKDRVAKLKSKIGPISIKKNMGWCDDPLSKQYNSLIKFPFKYSAEKLYKTNNTYDMVLVLDFNTKPVLKNKGSAIFIHVAKKKFENTAGCIAIRKRHLRLLIKKINKKTVVNIN